jgi:thiamine-phosphate pyrophosphorylase
MKLIVISPVRSKDHETRLVTELFEHGLETLHLRKPGMRRSEMREYIEAIPSHFHNRIVIHSHHTLARRYMLKGVHMTRMHLKKPFISWFRMRMLRVRKPDALQTSTFHRLANIYENKIDYNYVLLGTIFDPISGKFGPGYSEHSLRAALEKSRQPVIARGGTSVDNIALCNDLGFAGMAFASSIWKAENPVEAFCAVIIRCRELNIPVS